jgi:RecA-family ATPase
MPEVIADNNYIYSLYREILKNLENHELTPEELANEFLKSPNKKKKLKFEDESDLENIKEPEFLVNRFLDEGKITVLAGEAGTGKTYLSLELIRCVSLGEPFLSMNTKKGNCLFIDCESDRTTLKMRIKALEQASGQNMKLNYICEQIKFDNQSVIEIVEFIKNKNISLLVIDSLMASNIGANENDVKDINLYFEKMRIITKETGATIIIIHHLNKSGGVRGSSAIIGAVDNLYKLTAQAQAKELKHLKISSEKNRNFYFEPTYLKVHFSSSGTHFINCEKPQDNLLKSIVEYILNFPVE